MHAHELEEVKREIQNAYSQIFKTKRIIAYLESHGKNSFPFFVCLTNSINCLSCNNEHHSLHEISYAEQLLDILLDEGWREEIKNIYFDGQDLLAFYYWIGTYVMSIRTRFLNLNIESV